MTDEELRSMLQAWEAPPAPEVLRRRVFRAKPFSVGWLLAGEVRVPVPLALAVLLLMVFGAYQALRPPTTSLSDFEQVKQFKPRIVRTAYENR